MRSLAHEYSIAPADRACAALMVDMHAGQVMVSTVTVRALIDEQFPQWRDRQHFSGETAAKTRNPATR